MEEEKFYCVDCREKISPYDLYKIKKGYLCYDCAVKYYNCVSCGEAFEEEEGIFNKNGDFLCHGCSHFYTICDNCGCFYEEKKTTAVRVNDYRFCSPDCERKFVYPKYEDDEEEDE